jgi:hypothetical protein
MSRATFYGTVIEIGEEKQFEHDGREHNYRTIVLETEDNKIIAANLWGDKPAPLLGSYIRFQVEIISERNRKMEGVFFHKINLKKYEYAAIPEVVFN